MNEPFARCQCGDLQVDLALPSKWLAHCHCSQCRAAHGAGFVTWIGMNADRCTLRDPLQRLTWYASSEHAERGFCGRCGSPMLFRSTRWPGELHIAFGLVHGEVDRSPQVHVHWESHVGWALPDAGDGLPRRSGSGGS